MIELFFVANPLTVTTTLAPGSLLTLLLVTALANNQDGNVLHVSLIFGICTIGKGGVFLCFWLPGSNTERPWHPGIGLCYNSYQNHKVENMQGLCPADSPEFEEWKEERGNHAH